MRKFLAVAIVFAFVTGASGSGTKASENAAPKPDYKAFDKKLSDDDKLRHALERLTFGPRPGDLEAVRKMGLRKWIDQQLHPEHMEENPELARRLEPLETLRISETETEIGRAHVWNSSH